MTTQLLHKFLWVYRRKHRQDLVWWVVTHLCLAGLFSSSFCKNLFSFKGTRAQAAQPWQHYGSGCVTAAMPCLQSVLQWLMGPRDPWWPCHSYQWASCREPQGFCHTDTLTSPSRVSCCKCFPLKLQLLYLACPKYSCFVHLWCCISKWVALCSQLLPHHKAVEQLGFANQQISISDLSYLLLSYFWPWLLQVYLQNTHSLSYTSWFREAGDSLTEFLVWTLETGQHVLMQ